jgi:hypothetical protein
MKCLSKLVELYVFKAEVAHQDLTAGTGNIGYLDVTQLNKGISIVMESLPHQLLAVDVNIPNISFHSFLTINDEGPLIMDDNLFTIIEGSVFVKCHLFISLLSPNRLLDSLQLVFTSFQPQFHDNQGLTHIRQRFKTNRSSSAGSGISALSQSMPQKIEVIFHDVNVQYLTDSSLKSLEVKGKKIWLDFEVWNKERAELMLAGEGESHDRVAMATRLAGFQLKGPHDILKLKQIVLQSKVITVEPPNKGHFGTMCFVLCIEVVLFSEVQNVLEP